MDAASAVGFVGSLTSCSMFVPQAIKALRLRHHPDELAGIAVLGLCLAMLNSTLWVTYAALSHAWWAGVPGLMNLPVNAFTVAVVMRYRRREPEVVERCDFCGTGVAHSYYLATSAGSGSTVACSPDNRRNGTIVFG